MLSTDGWRANTPESQEIRFVTETTFSDTLDGFNERVKCGERKRKKRLFKFNPELRRGEK